MIEFVDVASVCERRSVHVKFFAPCMTLCAEQAAIIYYFRGSNMLSFGTIYNLRAALKDNVQVLNNILVQHSQ